MRRFLRKIPSLLLMIALLSSVTVTVCLFSKAVSEEKMASDMSRAVTLAENALDTFYAQNVTEFVTGNVSKETVEKFTTTTTIQEIEKDENGIWITCQVEVGTNIQGSLLEITGNRYVMNMPEGK